MHCLKLLFLSKPERVPERVPENSHFPAGRGGPSPGRWLPRTGLPDCALSASPLWYPPRVRVSCSQQPCSGRHLESVEGVVQGKRPWCHGWLQGTMLVAATQPAKALPQRPRRWPARGHWPRAWRQWLSRSLVSCDLCRPQPRGSSVHGILQAPTLEWVVVSISRASSQPKDRTRASCTAGGFFTSWAAGKAPDPEREAAVQTEQRSCGLQAW